MIYDPNRGALFKNLKKSEPRHCDYRSECNIDGKPLWVTAWLRTAKSGERYMSLSFAPKDADAGDARRPATALSRGRRHSVLKTRGEGS
jgi:hypothetical protein